MAVDQFTFVLRLKTKNVEFDEKGKNKFVKIVKKNFKERLKESELLDEMKSDYVKHLLEDFCYVDEDKNLFINYSSADSPEGCFSTRYCPYKDVYEEFMGSIGDGLTEIGVTEITMSGDEMWPYFDAHIYVYCGSDGSSWTQSYVFFKDYDGSFGFDEDELTEEEPYYGDEDEYEFDEDDD